MKHALGKIHALVFIVTLVLSGAAKAEMIRELVTLNGADSIPVEGFGIVTGLNNTGDTGQAALRALRENMSRMGFPFDLSSFSSGSVALVRVRAEIPPFTRQGQYLRVYVTAINGAKSLAGGELLKCDLTGGTDTVLARATGQVLTGPGILTRGVVPPGDGTGALVLSPHLSGHKSVMTEGIVRLNLKRPNWGDASTISRRINQTPFLNPNLQETALFSEAVPTQEVAIAKDAGQVVVLVPPQYRTNRFSDYIASLLEVPVTVNQPAVIVVNRARNSIVVTGDIRVNNAMVSLQDKTVTIRPETPEDPAAYTLEDGTPRTAVELDGPGSYADLQSLIDTLNAMGLTTEQIITMFEELRASGTIHADFISQ